MIGPIAPTGGQQFKQLVDWLRWTSQQFFTWAQRSGNSLCPLLVVAKARQEVAGEAATVELGGI